MMSNVLEGMVRDSLEILKLRITATLKDDFKFTPEIIEEILAIAESEKNTSKPEVSFFMSVFNDKRIQQDMKNFLLISAEEGNYGIKVRDYVKINIERAREEDACQYVDDADEASNSIFILPPFL